MKKLFALVVFLAIAAVAVAFFATGGMYAGFEKPVTLEIPRGMGTRAIAAALSDAGVVRYPELFLAARALRPLDTLQAGEYRFDGAASPRAVLDRIVRGDIVKHFVSVPEGSNIFDIAEILKVQGMIDPQEFLRVARDPAPIRDLAPQAKSLEGFLFPASYQIARSTKAAQLAGQMTGRFREAWDEARPGNASVEDTVALASMIEKETGAPGERPLISGLFHNRLKAGMSLDCDPTVIYAAMLEGRWDGVIHRSDLDNMSPYNTYRHAGLPPGPIANPGAAALAAALRPVETKALFFVAKPDGSGTHVFSETLAEHERNVSQYRRGSR